MSRIKSKNLQPLKKDIKDLGSRLGRVMSECDSPQLLKEVEWVRLWAKKQRKNLRKEDDIDGEKFFKRLDLKESYKIARAFTEFLRLANAAEQHHRVRRRRYYETHSAQSQPGSIEDLLIKLKPHQRNGVLKKLRKMEIDLVITAHPTEAMRQSALRRYKHISQNLSLLDQVDSTKWEKELAHQSIDRSLRALWLTEIVQEQGPDPLTEAQAGFSVVEEILWDEVPRFYRKLDYLSHKYLGDYLGMDPLPLRFSSWVGGDRDGNPYVTAQITRQVIFLGMAKAYRLISEEVEWLIKEMTYHLASPELLEQVEVKDHKEPYRPFLVRLYQRLQKSLQQAKEGIENPQIKSGSWEFINQKEILTQLKLLYQSLLSCGAPDLAMGRTLDLMRRVEVFGVSLLPLDLRQSADVHAHVIAEWVEKFLGKSYLTLSEKEKVSLLNQLLRERQDWGERESLSPLAQEVISTCRLVDDFPHECFRAYVVSMTEESSDLLEVLVLFKMAQIKSKFFLTPLLETPESLKNGSQILQSLLQMESYRNYVGTTQQVMLGYSDSAKRSGRLSSAWLLHQVQGELDEVARKYQISFEYFHGRGGSIGRGGGPVHLALRALPRGTAQGRLRITEQGESVHSKFGLPGIAQRTMELYVSGVLEASINALNEKVNNEVENPKEYKKWQNVMEQMAEISAADFRHWIYENDRFLTYFSEVTPIKELNLFKIGSRPAKRKNQLDFDSLRAIPWVYSWTQNRALLPSWLGLGAALEEMIHKGQLKTLRRMYQKWPFFRATMNLFEMVLAKVDIPVFRQYSKLLVNPENQDLSNELVRKYLLTVKYLKEVTRNRSLLDNNPVLKRSIAVRTPYVDVLNLLQAYFLKQYRQNPNDPWLPKIIALTIGGISAGMRNTG